MTACAVGVSVGVQPDIDTLLQVVRDYLFDGYQRIKLKIKPGWDIEPTRAVRETWPDLLLQVDANSIYRLADAEHLAKQLDQFDLLLVEQPLDHDDIFDHAKLKPLIDSPLCLDESIVSPEHARWAMEMDACDIINIKPGRIGGLGRLQAHPRHGAGGRHSGLARRHVGDRHRPRLQRGAGQSAQLHAAGRHQRQRPLLRARHRVQPLHAQHRGQHAERVDRIPAAARRSMRIIWTR